MIILTFPIGSCVDNSRSSGVGSFLGISSKHKQHKLLLLNDHIRENGSIVSEKKHCFHRASSHVVSAILEFCSKQKKKYNFGQGSSKFDVSKCKSFTHIHVGPILF